MLKSQYKEGVRVKFPTRKTYGHFSYKEFDEHYGNSRDRVYTLGHIDHEGAVNLQVNGKGTAYYFNFEDLDLWEEEVGETPKEYTGLQVRSTNQHLIFAFAEDVAKTLPNHTLDKGIAMFYPKGVKKPTLSHCYSFDLPGQYMLALQRAESLAKAKPTKEYKVNNELTVTFCKDHILFQDREILLVDLKKLYNNLNSHISLSYIQGPRENSWGITILQVKIGCKVVTLTELDTLIKAYESFTTSIN